MEPDISTAAGVLLGFQVTAIWWRVQREVSVSKPDIPVRITPADYLNLLAMIVLAAGVFVIPTVMTLDAGVERIAFGAASILFTGHAFGVVGHYGLFNPGTPRPGTFFPLQERLAVGGTVGAALIYLLVAVRNLRA